MKKSYTKKRFTGSYKSLIISDKNHIKEIFHINFCHDRCALTTDLDILPDGDDLEIGDKGLIIFIN